MSSVNANSVQFLSEFLQGLLQELLPGFLWGFPTTLLHGFLPRFFQGFLYDTSGNSFGHAWGLSGFSRDSFRNSFKILAQDSFINSSQNFFIDCSRNSSTSSSRVSFKGFFGNFSWIPVRNSYNNSFIYYFSSSRIFSGIPPRFFSEISPGIISKGFFVTFLPRYHQRFFHHFFRDINRDSYEIAPGFFQENFPIFFMEFLQQFFWNIFRDYLWIFACII